MACEACSTKFTLFKRKKQCTDCLRYFCSECVIKRTDRVFSCDNCSMLSRRPLIRSQVTQMRSRDLRQYLLAKRVSIAGCVEKEELVSLIMLLANGRDDRSNNHTYDQNIRTNAMNIPENDYFISTSQPSAPPPTASPSPPPPLQSSPTPSALRTEELPNFASSSPPNTSESNVNGENVGRVQEPAMDTDAGTATTTTQDNNVEIEEIFGSDYSLPGGPEPLITEQEEISEPTGVEQTITCTEVPVWSDIVKLSDINQLSDLDTLSVKQLKNLLSTNRVDFKGCVERCELLDRASRLWEEYRQSRADVEKLDEENLCKICWDAPIECVILECGHMACCINCGKQMSECPICKQYVVRVVRFFKA